MSRVYLAGMAAALITVLTIPAAQAQQPTPPAQPQRPQIETKKVDGTDNVYIFRNGNHQAMFIVTSRRLGQHLPSLFHDAPLLPAVVSSACVRSHVGTERTADGAADPIRVEMILMGQCARASGDIHGRERERRGRKIRIQREQKHVLSARPSSAFERGGWPFVPAAATSPARNPAGAWGAPVPSGC